MKFELLIVIIILLSFVFPLLRIHREALPRLDNYRLSLRAFKRPSISLLHGEVLEHIPVSIDILFIEQWITIENEMYHNFRR